MAEKYNYVDPEQVLIFSCSGGFNCGQITNQVATSLDILGIGRFYCLAESAQFYSVFKQSG